MADVAAAWKEHAHPETGKKYYYNKITKETQWTRPADMAGGDDAPTDDAANDPALWATVADPKTGKTYYYNKKTKQTSWKKPACIADSADGAGDDDPAHWRETKDEKTGKPYWYNKVTKKTTWKNPIAAAEDKEAAASGDEKDDADDDKSEEKEEAGEEEEKKCKGTELNASQMMKMKQAFHVNEIEEEKSKDHEDEEDHEFTFAKHRKGWFNRTFRVGNVHDEGQLLTFKKSLIKKALLKQNRALDPEAVQAFKNVMSYMGDRKSSKTSIEHAKKMIRNLMQAPAALRDEVYMQLCKQTTANPRSDNHNNTPTPTQQKRCHTAQNQHTHTS